MAPATIKSPFSTEIRSLLPQLRIAYYFNRRSRTAGRYFEADLSDRFDPILEFLGGFFSRPVAPTTICMAETALVSFTKSTSPATAPIGLSESRHWPEELRETTMAINRQEIRAQTIFRSM